MTNSSALTLNSRPRRCFARSIKTILFTLFVALLMLGCRCGDSEGDSPESNETISGMIDLDDPGTLDNIFAEAMDAKNLFADMHKCNGLGQKLL